MGCGSLVREEGFTLVDDFEPGLQFLSTCMDSQTSFVITRSSLGLVGLGLKSLRYPETYNGSIYQANVMWKEGTDRSRWAL